ncbi:hypothetical protein X975_22233, partial [Stegodyphus mimosarum]
MKFYTFLSILALFSTILLVNSDEKADDIFEEYIENKVCHEPNGIPKTLHCLNKLSDL